MSDRKRLAHELANQLAPVTRVWRQLADQALASLGISNSAGWALVHIQRLDPGVRQAEVARVIGITEASLTPVVRQLERAGLLDKAGDVQDRRINRLYLTDEGWRMALEAEALLVDLRRQLLEGIGDEELAIIVAGLSRIGERAAKLRRAL